MSYFMIMLNKIARMWKLFTYLKQINTDSLSRKEGRMCLFSQNMMTVPHPWRCPPLLISCYLAHNCIGLVRNIKYKELIMSYCSHMHVGSDIPLTHLGCVKEFLGQGGVPLLAGLWGHHPAPDWGGMLSSTPQLMAMKWGGLRQKQWI